MSSELEAMIERLWKLHAEYTAVCESTTINLPLVNTNHHVRLARMSEQAFNALPTLLAAARPVVKLPQRLVPSDSMDTLLERTAKEHYNAAIDACTAALAKAGVTVEGQ